MATPQEIQKKQQQRQQWARVDPLTTIQASREALYQQSGMSPESAAPIEEALSQFEHILRATAGSSVYSTSSGS